MLFQLEADQYSDFPAVELAETEPDGLLAVGGDLTIQRLLNAYAAGIFPWFDDGQPILWWSPNPRAVLFPQELHQSRSLKKLLRKQRYQVSSDRDFSAVIHACAAPRDQQSGTWILPAMIQAYEALHEYGGAHSIEVWDGEKLVGGLYGVALGQVFFGESMFSRVSSASRIALVSLVQIATQTGIQLIDCQMHTQHLSSMGAFDMPRAQFISLLRRLIPAENPLAAWPTQAPRFP